jgi:hypothetical protein
VGPRAGLDHVEKRKFLTLPGLELLPLGRPARSQSLYRLLFANYQYYVKENYTYGKGKFAFVTVPAGRFCTIALYRWAHSLSNMCSVKIYRKHDDLSIPDYVASIGRVTGE